MGQFDRYIERNFEGPPTVERAFAVLATIAWIVKAIDSGRLEDILLGVFFVVMLLPMFVAPTASRAWFAALDRRPVLHAAFTLPLMTGALFAILAEAAGLSRPTSILIALPVTLVFHVISALRRRARLRAG